MSGRPEPFKRGEILTAARLNEAVDARLASSSGSGAIQTAQHADEAVAAVDIRQVQRHLPKHIAQFKVKSVSATYYICRLWDGTKEGSIDIRVAK